MNGDGTNSSVESNGLSPEHAEAVPDGGDVDNPDAIALRSAISILKMQREQSKTDLRRLEQLKHTAVASPQEYMRDVLRGRIHSEEGGHASLNIEDQSEDDEEDYEEDDDDGEEEEDDDRDGDKSRFGNIPKPQNVVRCPPVNWEKYHVVGESLDKLHEEQRLYPALGQPGVPTAPIGSGVGVGSAPRASKALVAAPFRPTVDNHIEPMKTRSSGRKSS